MIRAAGVLTLLGVLTLTPLWLACGGGGGGPTSAGIHARMGYSEERGLRVVDVPPGSPSEEAGLKVDDRIVVIDGELVSGMSMQEIVESLRGNSGSEVEIEIARPGEEDMRTLRIRRAPHRQR